MMEISIGWGQVWKFALSKFFKEPLFLFWGEKLKHKVRLRILEHKIRLRNKIKGSGKLAALKRQMTHYFSSVLEKQRINRCKSQ